MSDENPTHTVRATINPDVEIEVGPQEYLDLKRQGLLHEQEAEGEPEANDDETPARVPYHARKKSTQPAEGEAPATAEADDKKEN